MNFCSPTPDSARGIGMTVRKMQVKEGESGRWE